MSRAGVTKAISGNAVKNNGGSIIYGGTTNRTNFVTLNRTTVGYKDTFGGTRVKPPAARDATLLRNSVATAVSGVFGQMRVRQFMIRTVSTLVAGSTNKSIYQGSRFPSNSISVRYKEFSRTLEVRQVTYNYVTGRPTTLPGVQYDSFGTDNAAHPFPQVNPGYIVVKSVKLLPLRTTYRARTLL